jgi:hypothetical protein
MVYFYLLLEKLSTQEVLAYQVGATERKQIQVSELPPKGSLPCIAYTSFGSDKFSWRRTFWFAILPDQVTKFQEETAKEFNQKTNKKPNLLESLQFISENLDKIGIGAWEGLFKDFNEGPTFSKSGGSSFFPFMILKWGDFEFESVMDSCPRDVEISDNIRFLPFTKILGGKTE